MTNAYILYGLLRLLHEGDAADDDDAISIDT